MRFLVISYDNDEQRAHYDIVIARTEDEALQIGADLRPEAVPVTADTVDELREAIANMETLNDLEIQQNIRAIKKRNKEAGL